MSDLDTRALLGRLDPTSQRALLAATGACGGRGGYEVTIDQVLLQLVNDDRGDLQRILRHYEIDHTRLRRALQEAVEAERDGNAGKPSWSPLLGDWFRDAWLVASVELDLAIVRPAALFAAILWNPNRYRQVAGRELVETIGYDRLRRELRDIMAPPEVDAAGSGGTDGGERVPKRGGDSALGRFTIDFTGSAREGRIDPVFCRDREIRQMIDILGRRRKNNPIAVGEAGVGKTAVIEGLALKVVEGDVPDFLKNVEIYGLDMGLLQAGASVKGEFENRLKQVIDEVKASPRPIILFIDEAHTLIGAGGATGGSDAANLLKPALARGELRTVAATTWSEYKKYFEKDPALARRFQLVKLDEPSPDDAVTIVRGLRERYEAAHGVYIRDDGVEAAARLSARYISGRQLPDKAVDVLDTACARVKLSISAKPHRVDDLERAIRTLERQLDAVRRDLETETRDDHATATDLEARIATLNEELAAATARWERERDAVAKVIELRRELRNAQQDEAQDDTDDAEASTPPCPIEAIKRDLERARAELESARGEESLIHYEVCPEVVGKVIADWTGIPLGSMVRDEAESMLTFEREMTRRVKGQDHAAEAIGRGIRAAKAGVNNPDAPMGVFLLVGPSGVGKTETALGVADLLFGGERFMTTINMSEFQEKHSVSRLIGSPPGYVGYGEGGVLTEGVRQRPYSVVLLDEVEKADLEVMNLFYQVFDKGTLSDGEGRIVDFRNTVLFLTSNLATEAITELCADSRRPTIDEVGETIRPILSRHFKPALLGRMEVIPYYPVAGEVLGEIAGLKLAKVGRRLAASHGIRFSYLPEVVQAIAERCTEVESGARNVDHIINRTLLPAISSELLERISRDALPERLEVTLADDGAFRYRFDGEE